MENCFFHDLYKAIKEVQVRECAAKSLSHLLHGYLSVYSMVRICPELEKEYGTLGEIHGRSRDVVIELSKLIADKSVELDERIGYVADMVEAYQVYEDMNFLDQALNEAYNILPEEGGKVVLPKKTPNLCRLLCDSYYFTNDDYYLSLAREVVEAWENEEEQRKEKDLERILAVELYGNMIDRDMFVEGNNYYLIRENLEQEALRVLINKDMCLMAWCFVILAMQKYRQIEFQEQERSFRMYASC